MIVSVKGKLEAVGADWVHVEVGGVTLQISVPASNISHLGPLGGSVQLFTNLRIRDEQPVMYGFPTMAALELFIMLTGVSGVGPRLALALLSSQSTANLQGAISQGNVESLSSAPGVGRRTAGRIVLELKNKLADGLPEAAPMPGSQDAEVVEALMALGYSTSEARQAVNRLTDAGDIPLEERIRMALQNFGSA